ncbi:MAG: MFS transporter [Candidatus Heimdallarchaeaceae archaeon]
MKINLNKLQRKENGQVRIGVLISGTGIGVFMASLDATVAVILLELIRADFNVSPNKIQWVVLSYLLVMMAFTIIAGDLGDKISNKHIFQLGMLIFALGSFLCFLSHSLMFLIFARAIQSLGATGMIANGIALVTRFTTRNNRGKAMGLSNLIISVSVISGPLLGALITHYYSWRVVFLVNVPIGLVGLIWGQFAIPETPSLKKEKKADYIGSLSFASFLTLFMLSLSLFVEEIVPNSQTYAIISLVGSIIFFPIFIWWEGRHDNPLIDLKLLKDKKISFGLITAVMKHQGYIIILYHLNIYLQAIHIAARIDNIELPSIIVVGLIISGLPVGMAIMAVISGYLSDKIDARYLCTAAILGVVLMLILLFIFLSVDAPIWFYVIVTTIIGVCIGLFQSPNINSVMSAAPKDKVGVISGLHGLTTSIGISLGTAISTAVLTLGGTIIANSKGIQVGNLVDTPEVYVPALRWMFLFFAIITSFGAIISYLRGPENREKIEEEKLI